MPVASLKASSARLAAPPLPEDAYVSAPGLDFASAMRSFTDRTGNEGWTTRILGQFTSTATGMKSRTGSYLTFLRDAGSTAYEMLMVSSGEPSGVALAPNSLASAPPAPGR